MSQDWNSGWTPPGYTEPSDPSGQQQQSGWDWSGWDKFWQSQGVPPGQNPWDYFWQQQGKGLSSGRVSFFPGTTTDFGEMFHSIGGAFQESDETKLAEAIAKKMGIPTPLGATRNLRDAYMERIARDAAHRAMTDPTYRQQLAVQLGWNMQNPHVMYFIQHGTNMPDDPTGSGVDPGKTGTAGGAKPSAAAAKPSATAGSPFAASAFQGYGYGYQAVLAPQFASAAGVANNPGVDYDVAAGTPLDAMMAGTVVSAGWDGPYGISVLVKMQNGYTYRYSHMESLGPGVVAGATVQVGQQLGAAGMTGNASGPHVNIEMHDEKGQLIDPTPIVSALMKGDIPGATQVLSDYQSAGSAGPIRTTDGHLLYPGSQDYNVYFAAQNLWRKRYGGEPPWSFVSSLIADGKTTTEQVQEVMDSMSSDITGMDWGQRDQFATDADKVGSQYFSRPLPASTLKRLAAEGITTPGQLDLWAKSHPASSIDSSTYGAIYDQAAPQVTGLWSEPPSPDMVADIHKRMQAGPQQ